MRKSLEDDSVGTSAGSGINPILKFDLLSEVKQSKEGQALVEVLTTGTTRPTTTQRQLLVRLAVAALVKHGGKDGCYPPTNKKVELAKEIVKVFPSVKDSTPGMEGHETFYNNGLGFIEYRLKTIRFKLVKPEERRNIRHTSTLTPAQRDDDDGEKIVTATPEIEENINLMKYTPPTRENRNKILESFQKTFQYRRQLISQQQQTVTQIFEVFPRFKDAPFLINVDFSTIHGEKADSFLSRWPAYRDGILKLGERDSSAVKDLTRTFENGNEDLCGLIVLSYLLHRSTTRKKGEAQVGASRAGTVDYFYQCKPVGTIAEVEAESKIKKFKQPFLMGFGRYTNPKQFFVILDTTAIEAGDNVVQAFDMLFKSFYVFNLEYPSTLMAFWEFIDSVIYQVMSPASAKPRVREVSSSVRALMSE